MRECKKIGSASRMHLSYTYAFSQPDAKSNMLKQML